MINYNERLDILNQDRIIYHNIKNILLTHKYYNIIFKINTVLTYVN